MLMPIQTNAINAAYLAIGLTSFFGGSKFMEYRLMSKKNKTFIENINYMSSKAIEVWAKKIATIENQLESMRASYNALIESENEHVERMLETERERLKEQTRSLITNKERQMELEAQHFYENIQGKIKANESLIMKLETQINARYYGKEKEIELIKTCHSIIEEDNDQLENTHSLSKIKQEFRTMYPILRQYYSLSTGTISTLAYFVSYSFGLLIFNRSPIEKYDVLAELHSCVENGDLKGIIFIYNTMKGWPRLILKDWTEKCRQRLEFVDGIKRQLYLNKI
jgi:hypothetical protein